jgi:hypothetical protein
VQPRPALAHCADSLAHALAAPPLLRRLTVETQWAKLRGGADGDGADDGKDARLLRVLAGEACRLPCGATLALGPSRSLSDPCPVAEVNRHARLLWSQRLARQGSADSGSSCACHGNGSEAGSSSGPVL